MGNSRTYGAGKKLGRKSPRANVSSILGNMIEREAARTPDVRACQAETYACCGRVVREGMTAQERPEGKICRRCA